jgi:Protein NO VEIN, C-terminal
MPRDADGESLNGFPTAHQLSAALRAGDVTLRHAGRPTGELRPAFLRTPTEAVFSSHDLELGADLLNEAGLVDYSNEVVSPSAMLGALLGMEADEACELLLDRLLEARRPLWITAAVTESGVSLNLVPEEAAERLGEMFPDSNRREAFLLALGQRFSADERKRVGELAEEHVVAIAKSELSSAGRDDLADQVKRVSLLSDQLGYDVRAPRDGGSPRRLEVKGTRSLGSTVAIFLSRNEARIALEDPDWYLVLCRVGRDETVRLEGWATGESLRDRLPTDPERGGAWQSTEIYVDIAELTGGLPAWRGTPLAA